MTEFETMPSPKEKIIRPQFKTSSRPEIQSVVDQIEVSQEEKHPDIDSAHTVRQIARDIAAPTILAERKAQKLKEAEAESRHDALTGLLNRRGWDEEKKKALAQAKRDGTPVSVLFGDVRDLGNTNNNINMKAGDELVKRSGKIIQNNLREGDVAGRWGGDEFGVIYHNTTAEQALIAGRRITEEMSEPQVLQFRFQGQEQELTMPIGFRAVVGELDPKNPDASETAIMEELSVMKNEEKALKAQGQPIGGNKIISITAKQQAA